MASFTGVGDSVTLQLVNKDDVAAVALSGTYDMTIALQRRLGSPGSGAWETITQWTTANATVAYTYAAKTAKEELRLIVLVDTSGTCTATLTDTNDLLLMTEYYDLGRVRVKWYQSGPVFYDNAGNTVFDARRDQRVVLVTDAAAYTVLAANSGKTHIMPDLTADCAITLPTPADGLEFTFIYGGIAADAQDWNFTTGSDTNYFLGGLVHIDTDANAAGDEAVPIAGDGNSNSKLNVLVPDVGTRVNFTCDGTNWYLDGVVVAATVPSFADQ